MSGAELTMLGETSEALLDRYRGELPQEHVDELEPGDLHAKLVPPATAPSSRERNAARASSACPRARS